LPRPLSSPHSNSSSAPFSQPHFSSPSSSVQRTLQDASSQNGTFASPMADMSRNPQGWSPPNHGYPYPMQNPVQQGSPSMSSPYNNPRPMYAQNYPMNNYSSPLPHNTNMYSMSRPPIPAPVQPTFQHSPTLSAERSSQSGDVRTQQQNSIPSSPSVNLANSVPQANSTFEQVNHHTTQSIQGGDQLTASSPSLYAEGRPPNFSPSKSGVPAIHSSPPYSQMQPGMPNQQPNTRGTHFLPKPQFLQHLLGFLQSKGNPIRKTPFIGGRPVDFYALYRGVCEFGGYRKVYLFIPISILSSLKAILGSRRWIMAEFYSTSWFNRSTASGCDCGT
jgi:hypothetical protein